MPKPTLVESLQSLQGGRIAWPGPASVTAGTGINDAPEQLSARRWGKLRNPPLLARRNRFKNAGHLGWFFDDFRNRQLTIYG